MGRGRPKTKKSCASNSYDLGSGEEEKIPAQKKRGRPQKMHKDETYEEEIEEVAEVDCEDTKTGAFEKLASASIVTENGKKRTSSQGEEKQDILKEGSMNGARLIPDESNRLNGFRHIHNRRKNKPRRAAEAVVECR